MEKADPDAENTARTASDLTIAMAEERLGSRWPTAPTPPRMHQEESAPDEVCLERARSNKDDLYLLNTDAIVALGSEGHLADLSGLSCAQNLREVVRVANTVDGKLVAIPQEVVAYGLFVNKDIFDACELSLPSTPEEFLDVLRGAEGRRATVRLLGRRSTGGWRPSRSPQAYADLYNGGDTAAEIEALDAGRARYSDYLRPGFEFLQTLIDAGAIRCGKRRW